MRFKDLDDNRVIYIIIAVLCLLNFFLGVRIVKKITDNRDKVQSNYQVEEEVISVFNNMTYDNGINISFEETSTSSIDTQEENLYVRLLSTANIYMESVYDAQLESNNQTMTKGIWSKISLFFVSKTYFKSQLPAIFNVFDATTASGNNVDFVESEQNMNEENKVIVLEDIVFIEDPVENNEGQELLDVNRTSSDSIKPPDPINLNHENPYILIYHTHGTESYLPAKADNFHTDKREYNILTIGEIIGSVLSENGHKLKHIDIYHDIPSYNESYIRSLSTAKDEINKNDNIKIVFDVHRDGVDEDASYIERAKKESKININGKETATFSMVIGPENPNKEELLKFAKYIKSISDKMYPGLCKGIIIKPYGKFNQYISDYYALIEVGSNLNTIDQAKESAKLIGEILNEVIDGIKIN